MIKFLDKETVLYFHADQIERYGGSFGIRDEKLLESALARPKAALKSKYLHKTYRSFCNASASRDQFSPHYHQGANLHSFYWQES